MITEAEANEKWCPHVRLAAPRDSEAAGTSGNRYGDDVGGNFRCIASACMAWRWGVFNHQRNLPEGDRTPCGYCGLSGKPESV